MNGRSSWRGAGLLALVGVLVTIGCAGDRSAAPGTPGVPARPPVQGPSPTRATYEVEIDISSGRENPVIGVPASVAQEWWLMVADQIGAGEDAVDVQVLAELPPTDPPYPDVRAPAPASAGVPGSWVLADANAVGPEATSLDLLVTRAECSNGITGEVLAPKLGWAGDQLIVRTDTAPLPPGARTCPGNDAVPITVELGQPLGEREILDAHCLRPPGLRTATCADGAVRWRP